MFEIDKTTPEWQALFEAARRYDAKRKEERREELLFSDDEWLELNGTRLATQTVRE